MATTNDYLSRRDFEELHPVYRTLGRTAGHVSNEMPGPSKREAYDCDITYGPRYGFGFNYLRDQIDSRRLAESPPGTRFVDRLNRPGLAPNRPNQRR